MKRSAQVVLVVDGGDRRRRHLLCADAAGGLRPDPGRHGATGLLPRLAQRIGRPRQFELFVVAKLVWRLVRPRTASSSGTSSAALGSGSPARRRRASPAAPRGAASAASGHAAEAILPAAADEQRCSGSPARNVPTGARRPRRRDSCSIPSTASRIGTRAPITRFTLKEIEDDLEAPTAELDRMCRDLVERARSATSACCGCCAFPNGSGPTSRRAGSAAIRASMAVSIFATTGRGRRSCSNTTPTRRPPLFETAVFQWLWLEDAIAAQIVPRTPTSSIRCTSA